MYGLIPHHYGKQDYDGQYDMKTALITTTVIVVIVIIDVLLYLFFN